MGFAAKYSIQPKNILNNLKPKQNIKLYMFKKNDKNDSILFFDFEFLFLYFVLLYQFGIFQSECKYFIRVIKYTTFAQNV